MATQLSGGEAVIKSWDYGISKSNVKTTANLTVTNRRIISERSSKKAFERFEVPLKYVKNVSGELTSPKARILVIILGIILIPVIIGIVILVKEYKRCHQARFLLNIYTKDPEGNTLTIGMSSYKAKKTGFFARLFSGKKVPKIKVDKAKAQEIIEQLGSIIMNYQNNN